MIPKTYDKVARLNDLRTDRSGWGHIDLGMVLEAWGLRNRSLGVSYGKEAVLWYDQQEAMRLNVILLSGDNVSEGTVDRIVWIIDAIRERGE